VACSRNVLFSLLCSVIDIGLHSCLFLQHLALLFMICLVTFSHNTLQTVTPTVNCFTDLSVDQDRSHCGPRVLVPQLDDETFTSFFNSNLSLTSKSQSSEQLDLCIGDLDRVVSSSRKL
jgi:hypothetical protein